MQTLSTLFLLTLACATFAQRINLPPNIQVEAVQHAAGSLFFAGNFREGSILLIDFATGFTTTVVPPTPGRLATGLSARDGRLFVAGGGTFGALNAVPRMFVYDIVSGDTIAACDAPNGALVNDVIADDHFAYYTDSFLGVVYVLRVDSLPRCEWSVLELPSELFARGPPFFAANGIVRFSSGVLVSNFFLGSLFFTDLRTNNTQQILPENTVPEAGGLAIVEHRRGAKATLLVTQGTERVISVWRLRHTATGVRARFVQNITSSDWDTPSIVALGGGRLVVGDPQFTSFPVTEDLPAGAQLSVLGFLLRPARPATHVVE